MGGGLMQLVAIGAQDTFLIENPKITFYKTVYFRHTNFSMESIENYFNGNPKLGHRITSTINRNGDLLKNLWLEVEMEGDLCNSTGHSLIEYVELEIGGQIIDTHYGEWLEILSELSLIEEKRLGYNKMINKTNKPPDPIYPVLNTSREITSEVINGIFEIVIPFNPGDNRHNTVHVTFVFVNNHTISKNVQVDVDNHLKISEQISILPKGINYNDTIIQIELITNVSNSIIYTIPNDENSIGYLPKEEELLNHDYIIYPIDERYKFQNITGINPVLEVKQHVPVSILVKSTHAYPFMLLISNDSGDHLINEYDQSAELVSVILDADVPASDALVDGVLRFTPNTIEQYIYLSTTRDIDNNLLFIGTINVIP